MSTQLVYLAPLAPGHRRRGGIVVILNGLITQLRLQAPIEIKSTEIQFRQFIRQEVEIPRTLVGFVIHQPQRVHLFRRQTLDADARNFTQAQLLCRQDAAVADDDHAVGVDHDRLDESVLPDALRHVGHLAGIVLLCIGGIGDDVRQPPHLNFHAPLLPVPDSDTAPGRPAYVTTPRIQRRASDGQPGLSGLRLCGTGETALAARLRKRRTLSRARCPAKPQILSNCPAILAPTRCAAPRRRGNRWNVLDPLE